MLERETGSARPIRFLKHHHSHAATAFLLSPFAEAAILTVDGVGEMATVAWGKGSEASVSIQKEMRFPHSLGLLYSAVTEFLGFRHHLGEDCVAALAPRGTPAFLDGLRSLLTPHDDGSFTLDQGPFAFTASPALHGPRFVRTFGPARPPGSPLEPRHLDMAASVQALLEERMVALARHVRQQTGLERLCLGGGVAQNAPCCSRILEEAGFGEVFVPPAPGNDGSALGAALALACHQGAARPGPLGSPALGPATSAAHARRTLTNARLPFTEIATEELPVRCATALLEHGTLAWSQGRLEFAHRAQGTRALLLDPRRPGTVEQLGHSLGLAEPRAGLGILVQEERCGEWFELPIRSPFQSLAPRARPGSRAALAGVLGADGRIPVQTIHRETWPLLWQLLDEVGKRSGIPLVAIMPLRKEAGPMACTPEEVLEVTRNAGIRTLALDHLFVDVQAAVPAKS